MNRLSKFLLAGVSLICVGAIASAQVPGVNTNFPIHWTLMWEPQTQKASFSVAATINAAAAATDIFEFVGSATKTVRVRRVMVNGLATTAINANVLVVKRTARDDGNATTLIPVVYDNNSPTGQNAATAVAERYAANPTEPTTATNAVMLAERFVALGNFTTAQPQTWDIIWNASGTSGPVLRGISETLAVNLAGVTYSGAQITVVVEWTEE